MYAVLLYHKRHTMSKTEFPYVSVNKTILRWAIKRSGKSVDKLTKTPTLKNLKEWLNGEKHPTIKQLEKFSKATYTPFGYMFFSNPPDEKIPIPYFQTRSNNNSSTTSNPSPNLIDMIRIIEQRQDWMREYLTADGEKPLKFVGSAKHTDLPKDIAAKMRRELGMGQEWASLHSNWSDALSDMKDNIEKIGIFVSTSGIVGGNTSRSLDPEDFRGFVLVDNYAPFIFVNNRDFKAAQMFTLAHELAHVWIGHSAAFDLRDLKPANDVIENACNNIAAEFLVPSDSLAQEWDKLNRDDKPFQAGARHFKVSEIVIARRALDTNMINRTTFLKFYKKQQKIANSKNKTSGGNYYSNVNSQVGKMFMRNVFSAVSEAKLLYRDAYTITGLNRKSFDHMENYVLREEST